MSTSTAVFTGWPADATAFLAELATDNTAEFWAAQRHRYDVAVRPPTVALATALGAEFGAVRVFRPYRDRRFRPDAPPYRTDTGGAHATAGGTDLGFVLAPGGLTVTVGRYALAGPALRRYRDAVVGEPGAQLVSALAEAAAAGLELEPTAPVRPRGYPAEHPRSGLLCRRAVQVGSTWPAGPWLGTHEPLGRIAGAWRAAAPLVAWLDTHAGSTDR
ncbi:MAG: DUF2461 domain-containing protein [Pseudonocardia sp.]|nr:DUF2461 domain-containing protein [Pseudonocardia sp.]